MFASAVAGNDEVEFILFLFFLKKAQWFWDWAADSERFSDCLNAPLAQSVDLHCPELLLLLDPTAVGLVFFYIVRGERARWPAKQPPLPPHPVPPKFKLLSLLCLLF